MQVILVERMKNLGNIGDVVRVKDGYARNFLLPQKKALRATKDNVAYFESKRAEIEARNKDLLKAAEKLAKSVDGKIVVVIRQASDDGRLYGSVSARDIAAAFQEQKLAVDRSQVEMGMTIKEIGIYPLKVTLHAEVVVNVKVNVARSESEAEIAEREAKAPKKAAKAKSAIEVLEEVEAATPEVAAEDVSSTLEGDESAA